MNVVVVVVVVVVFVVIKGNETSFVTVDRSFVPNYI